MKSTLLQLSAISCLEAIVRVLPHFAGPYLEKMLDYAMRLLVSENSQHSQWRQVIEKSRALLSEMAIKVQPRVLLSPLFRYLDNAVKHGKSVSEILYPSYMVTIVNHSLHH